MHGEDSTVQLYSGLLSCLKLQILAIQQRIMDGQSCDAFAGHVISHVYYVLQAVDVGQCVGSCSDSSRQCAAVETLWQNETSVYTIQQCGCQQSHDVLDLK